MIQKVKYLISGTGLSIIDENSHVPKSGLIWIGCDLQGEFRSRLDFLTVLDILTSCLDLIHFADKFNCDSSILSEESDDSYLFFRAHIATDTIVGSISQQNLSGRSVVQEIKFRTIGVML